MDGRGQAGEEAVGEVFNSYIPGKIAIFQYLTGNMII